MTQDLHIRVKSVGPHRRAGLYLAPVGHWTEHDLDGNDQVAGAKTLLALVSDPGLTVELGQPKDDGTYSWHPTPQASDITAIIEAMEEGQAELDALKQAAADLTGESHADLTQDAPGDPLAEPVDFTGSAPGVLIDRFDHDAPVELPSRPLSPHFVMHTLTDREVSESTDDLLAERAARQVVTSPLPTAESTLERPADTDTPGSMKATAEGDGSEEAAKVPPPTAGPEIPPSMATATPSPQEAPVAEAPVAVKTETKPKAKAPKPKV